jgi:hypothetical protein
MICQISNVKKKTGPLPALNRDLFKARHIQAHVKELAADGLAPIDNYFGSPMNSGPYLVPVTHWIE